MFLNNFDSFIDSKLKHIPSDREDTKAYVKSIFRKHIKTENMLQKPVAIDFLQAKSKYNFEKFQNVGDFVLFSLSVFPENMGKYGSEEYFSTIAQLSYLKCNRMMNGEWPLFEELGEKLMEFVEHIRLNWDVNLNHSLFSSFSYKTLHGIYLKN